MDKYLIWMGNVYILRTIYKDRICEQIAIQMVRLYFIKSMSNFIHIFIQYECIKCYPWLNCCLVGHPQIPPALLNKIFIIYTFSATDTHSHTRHACIDYVTIICISITVNHNKICTQHTNVHKHIRVSRIRRQCTDNSFFLPLPPNAIQIPCIIFIFNPHNETC